MAPELGLRKRPYMTITRVHIIGGTCRSRAEQARVIFALGLHAELYADVTELVASTPTYGLILAWHGLAPGDTNRLLRLLSDGGVAMPVIVTGAAFSFEEVVDAIRAGASDCLTLPLRADGLLRRIQRVGLAAGPLVEIRRREILARTRINQLNLRERQVLKCLASGKANKAMAKDLAISVRTVEIYRASMMTKLEAAHVAEAIKMWMDACIDNYQSSRATMAISPARLVTKSHHSTLLVS